MSMIRALALLGGALLATAGYAAEPPATAQAEIRHLLGYLEQSGCQFLRNGRWHSAIDARRHLERKYRYLVEQGLVSSAEDFIAWVGPGHEVDLTEIARQNLQMNVPIAPLHAKDCRGLCPICGANWNERGCEHNLS